MVPVFKWERPAFRGVAAPARQEDVSPAAAAAADPRGLDSDAPAPAAEAAAPASSFSGPAPRSILGLVAETPLADPESRLLLRRQRQVLENRWLHPDWTWGIPKPEKEEGRIESAAELVRLDLALLSSMAPETAGHQELRRDLSRLLLYLKLEDPVPIDSSWEYLPLAEAALLAAKKLGIAEASDLEFQRALERAVLRWVEEKLPPALRATRLGGALPGLAAEALREAFAAGEPSAVDLLDPRRLAEALEIYALAPQLGEAEPFPRELAWARAFEQASHDALARLHFRRAALAAERGTDAGARRQALLELAPALAARGLRREAESMLRGLLAQAEREDPASEESFLAAGLLALHEGRWAEAEDSLASLVDPRLAEDLFARVQAGRRLYRRALTVAALRDISKNFLERGRAAWAGGFDEAEYRRLSAATEAGWREIESRYLGDASRGLFECLKRLQDGGAHPDFRSGFLLGDDSGLPESEFHVASSVERFLEEAENPSLGDLEFHAALLALADSLASDGYTPSALAIYEGLRGSGFLEAEAERRLAGLPRDRAVRGLIHLAWGLACVYAGPSGILALNSTSGAGQESSAETVATVLLPIGAGKYFGQLAERLALSQGARFFRDARAWKAGGFAAGQLGFAGGLTLGSAALHRIFHPERPLSWGELRREFGAALITGLLFHGAQRLPALRGLDSGPVRWGRDIAVLTGAGYLHETLGLRESVPYRDLSLRIFEGIVLDLQFRLADRKLRDWGLGPKADRRGSDFREAFQKYWRELSEEPLRLDGYPYVHAEGRPLLGQVPGLGEALGQFLYALSVLRRRDPKIFARKAATFPAESSDRAFLVSVETLLAALESRSAGAQAVPMQNAGVSSAETLRSLRSVMEYAQAQSALAPERLVALAERHPDKSLPRLFLQGLEGIARSLRGPGAENAPAEETPATRVADPEAADSPTLSRKGAEELVAADLRLAEGPREFRSDDLGLPRSQALQLAEKFSKGARIVPLDGGYRLLERPSGAETLKSSASGEAEFRFYLAWKAERGFPPRADFQEVSRAWSELKARFGGLGIRLQPYLGRSARRQPVEEPFLRSYGPQILYWNALLRRIPDSVFAESGIRAIHLNTPRVGAGRGAAYERGRGALYLFSGSFHGARENLIYLTAHELGHALAGVLLSGKHRASLEASLRQLDAMDALFPWKPPSPVPPPSGRREPEEYLSDAVAAYLLRGPQLREHMRLFPERPQRRQAWESVYGAIRERFRGREFGHLYAVEPNLPDRPRVGFAYRDEAEESYGPFAVYTEPGVGYKPQNEDAFVQGENWAVVLDGMGGESEGARASEVAARAIGLRMQRDGNMKAAFHEAAEALDSALSERGGAVAVGHRILRGPDGHSRARIVHAGDATAIVFRKNAEGGFEAVFRTEDHNVPGQLRKQEVAQGLPRRGTLEMRVHPYANRVSNGLIKGKSVHPEENEILLENGDVLLMFSDGIGDNFTSRELADLIPDCETPKDLVDRIVVAAKNKMHRLDRARDLLLQPFSEEGGPVRDFETASGERTLAAKIDELFVDEFGKVYNREGVLVDSYKADNLTVHVYFHRI